MWGRTPAEAVNNYVDPIQLAVSCVSDAVVNVRGGYYPSNTSHTLVMNENTPVRLVFQHFWIDGLYTLTLTLSQRERG